MFIMEMPITALTLILKKFNKIIFDNPPGRCCSGK